MPLNGRVEEELLLSRHLDFRASSSSTGSGAKQDTRAGSASSIVFQVDFGRGGTQATRVGCYRPARLSCWLGSVQACSRMQALTTSRLARYCLTTAASSDTAASSGKNTNRNIRLTTALKEADFSAHRRERFLR